MNQLREKILLLAGYIGFALICGLLLGGYVWLRSPMAIGPNDDFAKMLQARILFTIALVVSFMLFLGAFLTIILHPAKIGWKRSLQWSCFHFDIGFIVLFLMLHISLKYELFDYLPAPLVLGVSIAAVLISWLLVRRSLARQPEPAV